VNKKAIRFLSSLKAEGIEVRAPNDPERAALTTFVAISKLEDLAGGVPQFNSSISRKIEHNLQCALGTDALLKYCIIIEEDNIIHFIPIEWIRKIEYVQAHPARSSGHISISIRYQPYGTNKATAIYLLRENGFLEDLHKPLAKYISEELSVPLAEWYGPAD